MHFMFTRNSLFYTIQILKNSNNFITDGKRNNRCIFQIQVKLYQKFENANFPLMSYWINLMKISITLLV